MNTKDRLDEHIGAFIRRREWRSLIHRAAEKADPRSYFQQRDRLADFLLAEIEQQMKPTPLTSGA